MGGKEEDRMGGDRLELEEQTSQAFFEAYYRRVFGADELQRELEVLRTHLPVTFRVNQSNKRAKEVETYLKSKPKQVKRLAWCDGWQLLIGDVFQIKTKFCEPELLHWKQWLARESKLGSIERQEAVSMLPLSVLGVEPGHKVLDMCASPGSKTAQALDALCCENSNQAGFVIANELDSRRAHILVHRLRRGLGPQASRLLAVVNHNAKTLPGNDLEYDRIVCDVPCSGDGTLRKNPGLWSHWQPHYGINLHSTQVQIAMRGLSLLKVGGTLVYSTCSLNPIENEAVVAALLQKCDAAVELVEIVPHFEKRGLNVKRGLSHWVVIDDTATIFKTFLQAKTRSQPRSCRSRFRPSMWPPTSQVTLAHLNRCVRIMPSDSNTGGFFVALFKKTAPLPMRDAKQAGTKRKLCSDTDDSFSSLGPDLQTWATSAQRKMRIVSIGAP